MSDDQIYDEESYPNIYTFCSMNARTKEGWVFEISDRKSQEKELRNFCKQMYLNKDRMVGFNNIGYDYPLLHFILKNKGVTAADIYEKTQELIESMGGDNKFGGRIKPSEIMIDQLDLYLINHFDNVARATSLKVLEFNMRSRNIEDLPFPVGTFLDDAQKDVLIKYNQHDVLETYGFYKYNLPAIAFREEMSKKRKKNVINYNDTKLGKDYFITRLEEESPGICYKQLPGGGRKPNQTKRNEIALKDCIVPYIKFERPEFNAVKDWLSKQVITETKGVFSDIEEHDLGDVAKYAEMLTKQKKINDDKQIEKLQKEHPMGWVEERELKSKKISTYFCWKVAENLNVVVDGLRYDYGTGGLHSSVESQIVSEDDEYEIIDIDAKAMYPTIVVANKINPEHLAPHFDSIYNAILEEREKHKKGTSENKALKLSANGTFGDTNNKYSPFYDPKATMTITLTGQLSLSMCCEQLLKIDGLSIIQNNTDGTTVKLRRKDRHKLEEVIGEWEKITGMVMEYEYYKAMYIRDCNNYIGQFIDDSLKMKGAYEYYVTEEEYKRREGENLFGGLKISDAWHKNQSFMVIQKAVEHELVKGGSAEHFIRNHKDEFDFCGRTKVPRSSRLVLSDKPDKVKKELTCVDEDNQYYMMLDPIGNEIEQQNICRYYVANDGKAMVKIMPPLPDDVYMDGLKHPETGETVLCKNKTEINKFTKLGYTEEVGEVLVPKLERRIGIETGQKVKTCNNMDDFDWDINYDYYIREARKLIDPLLEKDND